MHGGVGMFWRMRSALDGNFDSASTMRVRRSNAMSRLCEMRNKASLTRLNQPDSGKASLHEMRE